MTIYSKKAEELAEVLKSGGIVAYPTEGVWGLGCDPFNEEAVKRLLNIKHREEGEGFIVLASNWGQIYDLIDLKELPKVDQIFLTAAWPSHITFLLPKAEQVPNFITGESDQIALRITDFEANKELINAFGAPIISTSANLHGMKAARSLEEVKVYFEGRIEAVFDEQAGNQPNPSKIYDLKNKVYVR